MRGGLGIVASNTPTSFAHTGLPLGLQLNATTGMLSGQPDRYGTYSVTITARKDGVGETSRTFELKVVQAGSLTVRFDAT